MLQIECVGVTAVLDLLVHKVVPTARAAAGKLLYLHARQKATIVPGVPAVSSTVLLLQLLFLFLGIL